MSISQNGAPNYTSLVTYITAQVTQSSHSSAPYCVGPSPNRNQVKNFGQEIHFVPRKSIGSRRMDLNTVSPPYPNRGVECLN